MTKREILINNLRNLILIITENGKKIESLKTSLYINKLFDYSALCRRIDINKYGIISKLDFEKFLSSHTINAPKTIIEALFNIYSDETSGNDKYFSYDGFNYFLYPKNYISSRITSIYSKNTISFDLEEKVCNIILHEFALINEVTKALDNFYNDNTFTIYDIITFFYNGKEQTFINDILLEKFCIKYGVPITHNEMRLLLFYLKADSQNIITYKKLKDFFTTFVLDKTSLDSERNNHFFNRTLPNYISFSLDNNININQLNINNQNHDINLFEFLKEFLKLEYLLYTARKKLYLCDDFIPIELFYIFDSRNKNSFNISEFKNVLSVYFCIDATIEEVEIIFYNYADYKKNDKSFSNANCCINYENFKKMVLPYDCLDLPEKMVQPEINNLTNRTKSLIINFFQALFFVEKQIDNLRMNYFYKRDFSPYEEFIQIRLNNKKAHVMTKIMLVDFFEKFLNNEEKKDLLVKTKIDVFFKRLDKDGDMLFSYADFIKSIEPYCTNV